MGYLNTKDAFRADWREWNVEWKRWKRSSREILEPGYSNCGTQGETRFYMQTTEIEEKYLNLLEQFERAIVYLLNLIFFYLDLYFVCFLFHFCSVYFYSFFKKINSQWIRN